MSWRPTVGTTTISGLWTIAALTGSLRLRRSRTAVSTLPYIPMTVFVMGSVQTTAAIQPMKPKSGSRAQAHHPKAPNAMKPIRNELKPGRHTHRCRDLASGIVSCSTAVAQSKDSRRMRCSDVVTRLPPQEY